MGRGRANWRWPHVWGAVACGYFFQPECTATTTTRRSLSPISSPTIAVRSVSPSPALFGCSFRGRTLLPRRESSCIAVPSGIGAPKAGTRGTRAARLRVRRVRTTASRIAVDRSERVRAAQDEEETKAQHLRSNAARGAMTVKIRGGDLRTDPAPSPRPCVCRDDECHARSNVGRKEKGLRPCGRNPFLCLLLPAVRPSRSGRGSSPCSTPPRSRA